MNLPTKHSSGRPAKTEDRFRPGRGSAAASATSALRAQKLPGKRPVIDATDDPRLRAAVEAALHTGDGWSLPPGEFEPLIIRHGNLRVGGNHDTSRLHSGAMLEFAIG